MKNRNEFLILPGCDDTNRGDQALIWETVDLAKAAGFQGHYSMIARPDCGKQSKKIGIDSLAYLLPHPSTRVKIASDNRKYSTTLKIIWALRALLDLLIALPLSKKMTRPIAQIFLSREQKKTFEVYKSAKAAFVKGGGFLHAYEGLVDVYKIYFFLYHINLAHSMHIPVYVMPNSYGPFSTSTSRWLIKKCLSKCQLVCSRESISHDVLKENCGIDSFISPDLAMYLKKDSAFDARRVLNEKGIILHRGKMVGITVRPYRFPGKRNAKELYEKYKKSVCNLIKWLDDNGFFPVLIEHVFSKNFHERDLICINEISEVLKKEKKDVMIFSDQTLDCMQMKAVYAEMDYLIGTRFHSVIFALTENVPVIAITYGGNKGDGIMRDLNLSSYAIQIDNMDEHSLIDCFVSLVKKQNEVKNNFIEKQNDLTNEYNKIITAIRNCSLVNA